MSLIDLINSFVPNSYSQLDQIRTMIIVTTSLAIGGAMLLLIFYWVVTKSFETVMTVYMALAILLLLGISTGLVLHGQVTSGSWMLIGLMIFINFLNMGWYGISTPSSAAYVIPILLAIFCINSNTGIGIAIMGCIFVFTIPILQSRGIIKTIQTYKISNLTFDAPILALIYLLTTIITSSGKI